MVSVQNNKTKIAQLKLVFNKKVQVLKNNMNSLINKLKRSKLSPPIKKQYHNLYVSRYNNSVRALKNELSAKINALNNPNPNPNPNTVEIADRKFALLVGINYKNTVNELYGCINDANNIKALLNQKYGYNNLTLLTDDTDKKPTKQNIIDELTKLLRNSIAGDSLCFFFSGHGIYSTDLNDDELDGNDEFIVPIDSTSVSTSILDDELHKIIQDNLKPGVKFFALFDTCHSGSMLDLKYTYTDFNNVTINNKVTETVGQVFMISGCADDQTSTDAVFVTKKTLINTGVMTYFFLRSIEQEGTNVPIKKLMETMLSKLRSSGFTQTPLFSCGNAIDFDTCILDL